MEKFKKHFKIPKKTKIDFLDVPVDGDLLAFLCPFLIENNKEKTIAKKVLMQIESFLKKLNRDFIIPDDRINGIKFLSHLHEPNEFHLGYSDKNKGKGAAKSRSEIIYNSLRNNKFAKQGISITNEAHNVLLLVDGIGQDIMSDIIANVCRNIFAEYTYQECKTLGLELIPSKIEFYNPVSEKWETKTVDLPQFTDKIILVPKFMVCGIREYSVLYNWFIAREYISHEILNSEIPFPNEDQMIHQLKDGTRKAIIKKIYHYNKKPKNDLIDFVIKYKGSLEEFVIYAKDHYPELRLDDII